MRDGAMMARAQAQCRLEAALLACRSATRVLEHWTGRRIAACRVPGTDKPLATVGRAALLLAPQEAPAYRRVDLIAGGIVLCVADNWYVPARLDAAMNAALSGTDQPFGRIVAAPGTHRRVLSHEAPTGTAEIFRLRALVLRADGQALCLVDETYLAPLLDGAFPKDIP